MKEQFVTYDIALKLKELGFDEECLCTYGKSDKRFMRNPGTNMIDEPVEDNPYYWQNSKVHESVICAPLWQQVIDWFREANNLQVEILWRGDMSMFCYKIGRFRYASHEFSEIDYRQFEEAREQAILKALILIK